ncbi:Aste57867_20037 [Aphanomyces stellatus]|uniref:Aste57867_20037 protein n=1 Tax=Aphanomyces stellatus TaxID=120398 RepID=A0A485LFZ1_9STRA|nr:hypothetical protein As57867_019971 [Aphanomyces stellatus]VFT96733.1 Aste57867_20037 [Aphanomyces stellatus]
MFGRRAHMPRGGGIGGRGRNNGVVLMLFMQLFAQIQQLERKPPVTLALMGGMVGLFFYQGHPGVPTARRYALCPDIVVERLDWKRLVVSAFLHVDEWHLYNNMYTPSPCHFPTILVSRASFLWKGVNLEFKLGSERFVQLVGFLLVFSHMLTVAAAYALSNILDDDSYMHRCSIGFSAVLFALKIVLNQNSPTYTTFLGLRVPTKYVAWCELVYIHLFVPGSSFLGHLAGILAGYLYMKSPLWTTSNFFRASQHPSPRRSSYTYASGRATARPPPSHASDEAYARWLQEEEYRRR